MLVESDPLVIIYMYPRLDALHVCGGAKDLDTAIVILCFCARLDNVTSYC